MRLKQGGDDHRLVIRPITSPWLQAGVWALLLEATHPSLATEVFYVAGDRVVADPLCKPFSMGRNLFCVHSRKHLDDLPELKEAKQRTNRKTLAEMSRALNQVPPPRPRPSLRLRELGCQACVLLQPVCHPQPALSPTLA